MSRAWLEGRLDGVEPRSELNLLRATMVTAIGRGEDVTRLVRSVCQLDPVAGCELLAGPRALAHPAAVRAALRVADILEQVMPVSGLYRRLADLSPEAIPDILHTAIVRHGDTDWSWRLSSRERPPGTTPLRLLSGRFPARAPHRALDHDYIQAVVDRASGGDIGSIRALYAKAPREALFDAVCRILDDDVKVPIVAWIAALHGPDVDPIFAVVARSLRSSGGRDRLLRQAKGLPQTSEALKTP